MQKQYIRFFVLLTACFFTNYGFSQSVSISENVINPDTTAILDLSSTKKGLLIPRMTAQQKTAIASPATGLLVYQTDGDAGFYYYNGTSWFLLITSPVTDRQNTLIYTADGF